MEESRRLFEESLRELEATTESLIPREKDLKKDLKTEFETRIDELKTEFERCIDEHFGPQCRAVCDVMQQMLPQELRYKIYEHLFKGGIFHANSLNERTWDKTRNGSPSVYGLGAIGIRHICYPGYVSRETLYDIADFHYRYPTFLCGRIPTISKFLKQSKDCWGLDLNVAELI